MPFSETQDAQHPPASLTFIPAFLTNTAISIARILLGAGIRALPSCLPVQIRLELRFPPRSGQRHLL